ncbi:MAG: GrpB family protein [Lachnospiraceae bacterium]|nr:GrpB family protein [Lachnospiraceae bacterium]
MKVPEDFDPVCRSVTEDDKDEFLRWIDVDAPVKYYPEFFRTELLHKTDGIKHFITDGRRHIVVLPYDERWKQDFIQIQNELSAALGSLAVRIEHVGSTSVPGLSAKPIIDIDVVIRDYSVFEDVVSALGKIGYVHEGDKGIPAREVFGYEGKEHLREHHLYVCPEDSAELKRHTSFRDYLRSHPGAVQEYSRVKEEGAVLHPHDIDSYIEHKSPFIEKIYAKISV